MKSSASAQVASIILIFVFLTASCAGPATPSGPVPTPTLDEIQVKQTFEAAVAESVQGTLEAITGYSMDSIRVHELIRSDAGGNFNLESAAGKFISITLENQAAEKVANASILSAANPQGILLLVVPPVDSPLAPKFFFLDPGQTSGATTFHLDTGSSAALVNGVNAPPGLLETMFSSPGWQKMVVNPNELCNSVTRLSTLGSVAYLSYGAASTQMATMSLKQLAKSFATESAGAPGIDQMEGLVQLCLAATGDSVGLTELTGVIHPESGFGLIFLTQPIPTVVKGRAVDSRTNTALPDALAATATQKAFTLPDGTFYLPIPANSSAEISCEKAGFVTGRLAVTPISTGYADLGDIPLASVAAGFTEEFENINIFSQTSGNVTVEDGKAVWNVIRNGGSQFLYRSIPAFSGDVRITVTGQLNDWSNNCQGGIGIGDAPGSGVAVYFGFFGGGCATSGPVVTAGGVTLDLTETNCEFSPNWLWIERNTPYTVALTAQYPYANLEVQGVGNVNGTLDYSGEYRVLWVGLKGDGDWPACSGSFDSILVEPVQ